MDARHEVLLAVFDPADRTTKPEGEGRYHELYTKQHGLESNLFLAPGEGDTPVPVDTSSKQNGDEPALADAIRIVRGESR